MSKSPAKGSFTSSFTPTLLFSSSILSCPLQLSILDSMPSQKGSQTNNKPATLASQQHWIAPTKISGSGRHLTKDVISSFGSDKKKKAPPDSSDQRPRSKRRCVITPTSSSVSLKAQRRSESSCSPIPFNVTYSDEDLVAPHAKRATGTQAIGLRRLLPAQIACLVPGEEVVIVIPPMKRQIKESAKKGLLEVMRLFEDVLMDTCPNLIASEKKDQIALLKMKHEINRGGSTAFEFNV